MLAEAASSHHRLYRRHEATMLAEALMRSLMEA